MSKKKGLIEQPDSDLATRPVGYAAKRVASEAERLCRKIETLEASLEKCWVAVDEAVSKGDLTVVRSYVEEFRKKDWFKWDKEAVLDSAKEVLKDAEELEVIGSRLLRRYGNMRQMSPENDKFLKLIQMKRSLVELDWRLYALKSLTFIILCLMLLYFVATLRAPVSQYEGHQGKLMVAGIIQIICLFLYKQAAQTGNDRYVELTHLLEWRREEIAEYYDSDDDGGSEKALLDQVREIERHSQPVFFDSQKGITVYFLLSLFLLVGPFILERLAQTP